MPGRALEDLSARPDGDFIRARVVARRLAAATAVTNDRDARYALIILTKRSPLWYCCRQQEFAECRGEVILAAVSTWRSFDSTSKKTAKNSERVAVLSGARAPAGQDFSGGRDVGRC